MERSFPQIDGDDVVVYTQLGLCINVSHGGLCILIEENQTPVVGEVLRVKVPMSGCGIRTPTIVDVRWARGVPFAFRGLSLIGVKFSL